MKFSFKSAIVALVALLSFAEVKADDCSRYKILSCVKIQNPAVWKDKFLSAYSTVFGDDEQAELLGAACSIALNKAKSNVGIYLVRDTSKDSEGLVFLSSDDSRIWDEIKNNGHEKAKNYKGWQVISYDLDDPCLADMLISDLEKDMKHVAIVKASPEFVKEFIKVIRFMVSSEYSTPVVSFYWRLLDSMIGTILDECNGAEIRASIDDKKFQYDLVYKVAENSNVDNWLKKIKDNKDGPCGLFEFDKNTIGTFDGESPLSRLEEISGNTYLAKDGVTYPGLDRFGLKKSGSGCISIGKDRITSIFKLKPNARNSVIDTCENELGLVKSRNISGFSVYIKNKQTNDDKLPSIANLAMPISCVAFNNDVIMINVGQYSLDDIRSIINKYQSLSDSDKSHCLPGDMFDRSKIDIIRCFDAFLGPRFDVNCIGDCTFLIEETFSGDEWCIHAETGVNALKSLVDFCKKNKEVLAEAFDIDDNLQYSDNDAVSDDNGKSEGAQNISDADEKCECEDEAEAID